jgi:hypothetical protein
MIQKIQLLSTLKKINKRLIDVFNFILLSVVYFFGVSLSFLCWKISRIGKNRTKNRADPYWEDFEEVGEKDNYEKMY